MKERHNDPRESRTVRNLHGLPMRNPSRNQAGLHYRRRTSEKNGWGSDLKGFHTDREQAVRRNGSAVTTQRPQRGRALFDNTLRATTRADGARRWLNFRQGS